MAEIELGNRPKAFVLFADSLAQCPPEGHRIFMEYPPEEGCRGLRVTMSAKAPRKNFVGGWSVTYEAVAAETY